MIGRRPLVAGALALAASAPDEPPERGIELVSSDLARRVVPLVDRPDRPVSMTDLPDGDRAAALGSLRSALAVYPPGFVASMLDRVAMAGSITVWGLPASGLFGPGLVAISYVNVGNAASAAFDRDTLHHELSSVVRARLTFNVTDWDALNPPGFRYMTLDEYKRVLADPGPVDGDAALHRAGFVSRYGQTSRDNDWNTYAERVFGHGAAFARDLAPFRRMQGKTRQLIEYYTGLDGRFSDYFKRTGLEAAAPASL